MTFGTNNYYRLRDINTIKRKNIMTNIKRIFIVGRSGAGKGVLAQGIAEKLNWTFIDADFSLAPSIGRLITEIIGEPGNKVFHKCLSDILRHQCSKENIAVTTDDCIIENEENRKLLASEFTVYLKVSTPIQLQRISHNRPLLPLDNYGSFLDSLSKQHDALYEQVASLTLNSDDNDLDKHIALVLDAIIYSNKN